MPLDPHVKMRFYSPSVKMTVMTVESGSRATNTGATHTILGMIMPVGQCPDYGVEFCLMGARWGHAFVVHASARAHRAVHPLLMYVRNQKRAEEAPASANWCFARSMGTSRRLIDYQGLCFSPQFGSLEADSRYASFRNRV